MCFVYMVLSWLFYINSINQMINIVEVDMISLSKAGVHILKHIMLHLTCSIGWSILLYCRYIVTIIYNIHIIYMYR